MSDEKVTIMADEAVDVGVRALVRAGVSEPDARLQVDLLLEAELRGRPSHGLQRLSRIIERIHNGVASPTSRGVSQWRGTALLDVDGKGGLGPIVAVDALDRISARAKETGIATACIRNNNHLGMLAFYAERVASKGQAIIALSTSEALVHPWGGRKAMVGTNPIAIGVPATPAPFVLDMATSLVSMGEIHAHAYRGQPLAPGWALDADGNATLDAEAAKAGAIAPFGGAKGYALGLAFEVLVASLTASALGSDVRGTLDSDQPCNKGDVFIVIEPASSSVAASISAYLDAIRACSPADPQKPVAVPGDRAGIQRAKSLQAGVSLPAEIWSRLGELAGSDLHSIS
jgi:LDH2 family malate/lactate/ureidoglycolate dehydrogenase